MILRPELELARKWLTAICRLFPSVAEPLSFSLGAIHRMKSNLPLLAEPPSRAIMAEYAGVVRDRGGGNLENYVGGNRTAAPCPPVHDPCQK